MRRVESVDANQVISLVLLMGRAVTLLFVGLTIRYQRQLLRQNKGDRLQWYRRLLLSLAVVLFAGNIVPVVIDLAGLLHRGTFSLLLVYVFSNNLTAMLSAILTFYLYYMARNR